jgi:hypothetical protein
MRPDWMNVLIDYDEVFGDNARGLTPSAKDDHIPIHMEKHHRYLGCHLIRRAGRLLRLPQSCIMTAQVLLQRFYCQVSLHQYALLEIAMACTLIATKVEECFEHKLGQGIINVYNWLYQRIRSQGEDDSHPPPTVLDYAGAEYYQWKDNLARREMDVLRELGFEVQPFLPTGLLANYLNALEITDRQVTQKAINYVNDGLAGLVYLCVQPNGIAAAAISLACRQYEVDLPDRWFEVFDVTTAELSLASNLINDVYEWKLDFSEINLVSSEKSPPSNDTVPANNSKTTASAKNPTTLTDPGESERQYRSRSRSRSRSPHHQRKTHDDGNNREAATERHSKPSHRHRHHHHGYDDKDYRTNQQPSSSIRDRYKY